MSRGRFSAGRTPANKSHGMTASPTYRSWRSMRERCQKPEHRSWANYGGRGITVCRRWHSFDAFLADMGERPSRTHSLDRKNNSGQYRPGNCRWATPKEQHRNKRSNRMLTTFGETKCFAAWIDDPRCAATRATVDKRIDAGWSVERALSTPCRKQRNNVDRISA